MSKYSFADQETLLFRLLNVQNQGKKISVIVGAGLTMPNLANSELGVSSVKDIVDDIREYFEEHNLLPLFEKHVAPNQSDAERYQASMRILHSTFGQDELNNVIRRAVLNSMPKKIIFKGGEGINPGTLEKDPHNWYLRRGVDALGEIFVDFNEIFSGPILTSNFDPMLEISIRKHEGNPQSIPLVTDGKFLNHITDNTQSVVHLHGFWYGGDTLHTIDQLKRERPQLKGDLKKLLHSSVLLVIGYGGWDDVFTNSLLDLIKEGSDDFDVLWCFHENDELTIEQKYSFALNQLSGAIGGRVVLYKNVDCHELFPSLLKALNLNNQIPEKSAQTESENLQENQVEKEIGSITQESIAHENIAEESIIQEGFTCDIPPNNLYWVGRRQELELLAIGDYKTCFITGFGGQGKSGLASHFIKNIIGHQPGYELWDWRDCKEEDNKFQTIIISQIERLSRGAYRSSTLANETNQDLVNLLFDILKDRKIVFVFDNVDYYIDLVTLQPIGGILELVSEANKRDHHSLFVFTCRPRIVNTSPHFLELALKELTLEDTLTLFKSYQPPISHANLQELSNQAHALTNGHALWLTLIAAQAKRGLQTVSEFIKAYKQNSDDQLNNPSATLARTLLDLVWKSLNSKQHTLLRGMAELVAAVDKEDLENIFNPELSLNQFNKAFNFLNSLNLLVIKSQTGRKALFELHPLVKEYVVIKFKQNERSAFIMLIVNYYNQTIIWIKPKLNSDSPISYFEKYTQKAELQINNNDFKGALSSLQEIGVVIIAAGFTEEFIRVCTLLFKSIDWLKAVTQEYPYFHDQFYMFTQTQIERGNFSAVDENLAKYLAVIPGKSINYLTYCSLNSYYYWFKGEYSKAIEWSDEGLEIQKNTGVGGFAGLSNNKALALRDSGVPENLTIALLMFLNGENLDSILQNTLSTQSFSSNFFGNIGRCLWLLGQHNKALICYFKSFNLLLKEKNEKKIMNMGYACVWIAETALKKNDERSAVYFLKYCFLNWEKIAPLKAQKIRKDYSQFLEKDENNRLLVTASSHDVEKYCKQYVDSNLSILMDLLSM